MKKNAFDPVRARIWALTGLMGLCLLAFVIVTIPVEPLLAAGEALPSMRLLAKELRISVITTKRAYEELERDGFLENVPGKGCFVAPQNRELLREAQLRRTEEFLSQAVEEARKGGITLEELEEMLTILYKGDIL